MSLPRLIVSLFDYSGNWSRPYLEAGYEVHQVDIKLGMDVLSYEPPRTPWGVLAAPPCTIWTNAAAWMWRGISREVYELNHRLITAAVRICRSAERFWCLENPRGRLAALRDCRCSLEGEPSRECECPLVLGDHTWEFQPCDYGDAHTKRTCLWGNFNPPRPRRVLAQGSLVGGHTGRRHYPLFGAELGHRIPQKLPKKFSKMTAEEKEDRRAFRSVTPGFARQFFEANP